MSRGPPEAEIFLRQKLLVFAFHLTLLACQNSSARRKKLGGWEAAAPRVGQNNFFSGNRAFFRAEAKKWRQHFKNYKWKIWKIFHRLQQNKVPEIRSLWDEAFIFRALPHIFQAKSIHSVQKMARTPMQFWGNFRLLIGGKFPPAKKVPA